MFSLVYLKAKNDEKIIKVVFPLTRSNEKTNVSQGKKGKKEEIYKFKQKIICKVSVIVGKLKLCRKCTAQAHGQPCRFLGIELIKI